VALQDVAEYQSKIAFALCELLTRIFTLAFIRRDGKKRLFSVTLTQAFTCLRFPQHIALSCPDFPPNYLSDKASRRGTKVCFLNLSCK
jgi:hypothetical protein